MFLVLGAVGALTSQNSKPMRDIVVDCPTVTVPNVKNPLAMLQTHSYLF